MAIEDYKTMCCNAEWYVRSRGNFRCKKCNADVSLEILLASDALDKET